MKGGPEKAKRPKEAREGQKAERRLRENEVRPREGQKAEGRLKR